MSGSTNAYRGTMDRQVDAVIIPPAELRVEVNSNSMRKNSFRPIMDINCSFINVNTLTAAVKNTLPES